MVTFSTILPVPLVKFPSKLPWAFELLPYVDVELIKPDIVMFV